MNLKTDGTFYMGGYENDYCYDRIFFDFKSCAEDASFEYIIVFNSDGEFLGYLESVGGDYE